MTRKPVMHLLITDKCDRDCKYCCNKQYDVNDIPIVTKEEYESVDTVCLTGGEPFKYAEPSYMALRLKNRYQNIKNVYAYANAEPLYKWLEKNEYDRFERIVFTTALDGLSVSIKNEEDASAFEKLVNHPFIKSLKSNYLYVMNGLNPEQTGNFKVINREWQEDFKPAKNTIFRRLEGI